MSSRKSLSRKISVFALAFVLTVSMTGTVLPAAVFAAGGQTQIQKDVQKFIDKTDEDYAKNITRTLATKFPDNDDCTKYVPSGDSAYGFRNAGSEAEHQAADWLAGEFKKLGLKVTKDKVSVDKWEFNGAKFEMDGMTMQDPIVSYASSGTDNDGVTGEIVYLGDLEAPSGAGSGYAWAYEAYYDEHGLTGKDRNMNGKIVVCDIHQYADNWITPYYEEAYHQGAAGLITYSYQYCNEDGTQTGTKWDHCVQIQDLCSENFKVPCVAISRADGLAIKEQIAEAYKAGKTPTATLTVHNTVEKNGTSYNVVGTLKGTANTGQRIVISGHYDKYWYGFNDDCAAIGNVFGTAKAMVDAGYKPLNDIVFIAHGAEEWGQMGTETDWATGSWEEIYTAHPEWQGTTLGMINFELPAMKPDDLIGGQELKEGYVGGLFGCTEQVAPVLDSFIAGDLMKQVNKSLGSKKYMQIGKPYYHAQPMSDAYGWQFLGVPCYEIRGYYGQGDDFSIYHTPFDDEDHYAPEAMDWCIKTTAALTAQIDQNPAVEFSADKICDRLSSSIAEDDSIYKAAGVDTAAFKKEVAKLKTAGKAYRKIARAINADYAKAVAKKASKSKKAQIIKNGKTLNAKGLKAFRKYQDDILVVLGDSDAATRNESIQQNYGLIKGALAALKETDPEKQAGALDLLWQVNGGIEYTTYCFSDWAAADALDTLTCKKLATVSTNATNRAVGHKVGYVNTHTATFNVYNTIANGIPLASEGFKDEIAVYESAAKQLEGDMKTAMARQTKAVKAITKYYNSGKITPAKVTKVKAKNVKGKKVTLTWKKAKNAQSYKIAYKVKGAKKWSYKNTTKAKYTLKKLKKGKTYYFKVRAYSGTKTAGKWSTAAKVKIKK